MFTFCGPERESCVANQTLKDKSCLVPCSGLYADIWDNSVKQNMMAGSRMYVVCFNVQLSQHLKGRFEEPCPWVGGWVLSRYCKEKLIMGNSLIRAPYTPGSIGCIDPSLKR